MELFQQNLDCTKTQKEYTDYVLRFLTGLERSDRGHEIVFANKFQGEINRMIHLAKHNKSLIWKKDLSKRSQFKHYLPDLLIFNVGQQEKIGLMIVKLKEKKQWELPVLEDLSFMQTIEDYEIVSEKELPKYFSGIDLKKEIKDTEEKEIFSYDLFLRKLAYLEETKRIRLFQPKNSLLEEHEGMQISPDYIFCTPENKKITKKDFLENVSVLIVTYGKQLSLPFFYSEAFCHGVTSAKFYKLEKIQELINGLTETIIYKHPKTERDREILIDIEHQRNNFMHLIKVMYEFTEDFFKKQVNG